ncbi:MULTISPECIES: LacI family DNA-binding transcriptional regulator [unclassified Pantoea]|uniref:LacI family DNA-binding transcriptional regulator n=1 Tax=unclassified Pantoea TaxID=2630326 RepID=UPI001FA970B8|nr:LacI family DNA-binding transcriptional regulator [Pantoea sp. MQR6]
MKKVTLEMLAEKAGVGIATVDRVLNERGGVKPETVRKVLIAARAAGLQRLLPEENSHPWQIEVFLSSLESFFFRQLAKEFALVANNLGYRKITLHRTLVPESEPDKLAKKIKQSSHIRDGIIVFGHNYPIIYEALTYCMEKGVPVITLATDLPNANRLCHVGINQYQAGRTAGLLMSKSRTTPGTIIMVSGRVDFHAHIQRVAGFRDMIEQRAPHLALHEVLAGQDEPDKIRSLLNTVLKRNDNIIGLYNTGTGNSDISKILRHYHLDKSCLYITHELSSVTRQLLESDQLDYTLDQNAHHHATSAIHIMLRHLEQGYKPDTYSDGNVDLRIVTSENMS